MKSTCFSQPSGSRYQQPLVERIDIAVEEGFALSSSGNEGFWPSEGEGGWDD